MDKVMLAKRCLALHRLDLMLAECGDDARKLDETDPRLIAIRKTLNSLPSRKLMHSEIDMLGANAKRRKAIKKITIARLERPSYLPKLKMRFPLGHDGLRQQPLFDDLGFKDEVTAGKCWYGEHLQGYHNNEIAAEWAINPYCLRKAMATYLYSIGKKKG